MLSWVAIPKATPTTMKIIMCVGFPITWFRVFPTTPPFWAIRSIQPIPCGFGVQKPVNLLNFTRFNQGDYYGSVNDKVVSENLSKVLYPNDEPIQGKELRLQQQYFFVSCSLQDMIRIHKAEGNSIETFHQRFAVQLNDTHPAIGVAELMRLLVDEHQLSWDKAWSITQNTFNYTNHTLLPEALETWSLDLFKRLLPRHLEIIYEINQRFLDQVRMKYPRDEVKLSKLSLIGEGGGKNDPHGQSRYGWIRQGERRG